jgi:hypothetical protein
MEIVSLGYTLEMEFIHFLSSNAFGSFFYMYCGVFVLCVALYGYRYNIFLLPLARTLIGSLFLFTVFYLGYRFGSGYTPARMSEYETLDPYYILYAALHGTVSLVAIGVTAYAFAYASKVYRRGENYFRQHVEIFFILFIVWPIMVLSGLLI